MLPIDFFFFREVGDPASLASVMSSVCAASDRLSVVLGSVAKEMRSSQTLPCATVRYLCLFSFEPPARVNVWREASVAIHGLGRSGSS